MKNIKAKIISNERVVGRYYRLRIASPYLGGKTKPGQFFEVKCSEVSGEIFLRRPLGAHKIFKSGVEILYENVGKGTEALSKRKAGESLDVIGPLGNGFDIEHKRTRTQARKILVAGGIGVAPLVALAEEIARKGGEADVLIGARTGSHILCEKELKKLGCEVKVATDDGSKGHKGLITELLMMLLNRQTGKPANRQTIIYACGPVLMLKAVAGLAATHSIPCQVSLEERMACGVGVCLGCPVKVYHFTNLPVSRLEPAIRQTGKPANFIYKMVCKDGPVFDAKDIIW